MKPIQPTPHGNGFIAQFRHPKYNNRAFRRSLGNDKDLAHVVCEQLTTIRGTPELRAIDKSDHPDLAKFESLTRTIWFNKKDTGPSLSEQLRAYAKIFENLN